MSNCATHKRRDAVANCEACGAPICKHCYYDFDLPDDGGHLCAECYKEELRKEAAEISAVRGIVKRELIFIIIGLIAGLTLGLILLFDGSLAGMGPIFVVIWLPFLIGSLTTIVRKCIVKFGEMKDNSGDEGSWVVNLLFIIMIIAFYVITAPITTIYRFIVRIVDMRRLRELTNQDYNAIANIDNYIAQTTAPSLVEQTAGDASAGAVEISLDSILGDGVDIAANGAILRTIRNR